MKPAMPPPPSARPKPRRLAAKAGKHGGLRLLGGLDRVETDGTLEGWCWAPEAPQAQRTVAVTIDGHVVARAACNRSRPDLVEAGAVEGDHGFLVRLASGLLRPGASAEVALRDVATGQLVGAPVRVTWGAPAAKPRAAAAAPLSGNLDRVTRDGWVSGWCWDPAHPARRVQLDVLVDGAVVGSTPAANWRADLQQAGIGDGSHGFAYALPYEVLARTGTLRISVQEGGGGRLLGDPVTLRIGRLAESEQRVASLEQQMRLLRGRLEAFERQAADQPAAEERAARALFGTIAGFFRELADGTPEDARGYGMGRGLRATLEALEASLPPLALRAPPAQPAALLIVPATEPVETVHRCLMMLHEAGIDAEAELLLLDPGDADAAAALLPSLVRGLRYEHAGQAGLPAACNEAMARSAAPLLAIADPRVMLPPHWLATLRQTFADEPEAALVGSPLLRADGLLQHGGFAAARGALRDPLRDPGQFAEAELSEYRVLRPADAVAALAFAADRGRVLEAGGFDPLFRSLNHAAVALCLRLREAGGAVLVQPAAAAFWPGLEADPAQTTPALDGPDADAQRLRAALLAPPARPDAAPDRALGHALVVDDAVPRPDRDAGSVIALAQMRVLRRLGWRVTFAPASGAAVADSDRRRLERLGIEVALPPQHPSVSQYLRDHGASLDLVQLVRHANAAALGPVVRELAPRAKLVFAPADLHFLREAREAAVLGRKDGALLRKRARAREIACVEAADATLLLSGHEQELLASQTDPAKLHLLRWIAEPAPAGPGFAARDGLLFVGNFAHRPNADAVRWYAEAILPALRRLRPGLVLHVAGADPPPEVAGLAGPDIVVHGWVRDLDALLAQVRLSVAPLRYGAGFKGKVAASLAHGVPVVGTPVAIEGTGLAEGDGVAIARPPEAFARAVARLHDGEAAWTALSRRAVERVQALYSPEAAVSVLRGMLRALDLPSR